MRCVQCGAQDFDVTIKERLFDGVAKVKAQVMTCTSCGESYDGYDRMEDLVRRIAQELAAEPRRLRPEELKFLRKSMGFSGEDWARYLDVRRETVSLWENGHRQMPWASERLLRLLAEEGRSFHDYDDGVPDRVDNVQPMTISQNSVGNWVRI